MKLAKDANLDDVGTEVIAALRPYREDFIVRRKIQMIITAPRGKMVLFFRNYISPDTQCEAIRAFMEEHKND